MEQQNYWYERYRRIFVITPMFLAFFAIIICNLLSVYVLLYTNYWYLPILYLIWIFIDRNTCKTGGRHFPWLCKNFPVPNLPFVFKNSSDNKLDPNKNYLLCCFPHGVFSLGLITALSVEKGGFKNVFPNHKPYITSMHGGYFTPFLRELLFAFNCVSCSEESLNYLLNDASGGKAVALLVGGAEEIGYASEIHDHIVLKKRKGFARVALMNGSPLIPVYSFGLNSIYKYPQNFLVRRIIKMLKSVSRQGEFFYGQGIFQDYFGFTPFIKPITTIVGPPIDVVKNTNPSREDVEQLHEKFTEAIKKLFDEHKHKYLSNGKTAKLVIV